MKIKATFRVLAMILAIIMTLGGVPFVNAAEQVSELEEPQTTTKPMVISVSSDNHVRGAEVDVLISLENNPGIASMKIAVAFDSGLILESVTYNKEMKGEGMQPQTFASPVILNWYKVSGQYEGDCTYATLRFRISEDAQVNTVAGIRVTYNADDIYDENENNIECTVSNGSISIIDNIPGDINHDGVCNNKDLTRMVRYFAKWDVSVNYDALNTNNDEKVNNRDVIAFLQYLSGWDTVIWYGDISVVYCRHSMSYVGAKNATCINNGNTEYWCCTQCNKCFADENGSTEIAYVSTVILAGEGDFEHSLTKIDAKEPTCAIDGNIAYWYCELCNKCFKYDDGSVEISISETHIPAGHTFSAGWVYDEEYHWHAATCEHSELSIDKALHSLGENKQCEVCGFDAMYLYKLATPQDVTVVNDMISWAKVPNAKSYTVVVDGDYMFVTNNNKCFLTEVENSKGENLFEKRTDLNKHGEISVVVYANDNGNYVRSEESEPVTYYYVVSAEEHEDDLTIRYGLGLGYNMLVGFGPGMESGESVFDTSKLLSIDKLQHEKNVGGGGSTTSYYYTSVDDYFSQYENVDKLTLSAILKLDFSYGTATNYATKKYFSTYISRHEECTGYLNFAGQNKDLRIHCLSQQFLADIQKAQNLPITYSEQDKLNIITYILDNYGTHVALGIKKGGYFATIYSVWTNSESDLCKATDKFSIGVSQNKDKFFNAALDISAQGENTITTNHDSTISFLRSDFYGGTVSGISSNANIESWNVTGGEDDVALAFTNNGAMSIGSVIGEYEALYGFLLPDGSSLGTAFDEYVNSLATEQYKELYDKYTYKPEFDLEVVEENDKNVLVIDLSMYQFDGNLDDAGCSYMADGIFSVYPNMLGYDIDSVRVIGAMDKKNTIKQLLDGFSVAFKGRWNKDVDITFVNCGISSKSSNSIVDFTGVLTNAKVNVIYEGINVIKDSNGIYYCHLNNGTNVNTFILNDDNASTFDFGNTYIDGGIVYLPVPIDNNKEFSGWFDDTGVRITDPFGLLDAQIENSTDRIAVRAEWKPKTYTITLDDKGATTPAKTNVIYLMYGVGYSDTKQESVDFVQLDRVDIPKKNGYTFGGYYTRDDVNSNDVIVQGKVQYIDEYGNINKVIGNNYVAANTAFNNSVTLVAEWIPNTYTIEYDANTGVGEPFSLEYSYDKVIKLSENKFTKYKMSFICWNTKPDGSGDDYYVGQDYRNITSEPNGTVKMYAKWSENIVITLNAQKADNSYTQTLYMKPTQDAFYSDEDCKTLATSISPPARAGYDFLGFYDTVTNNETTEPAGKTCRITGNGKIDCNASDVSVYTWEACWRLKEFTASWSESPHVKIEVKRISSPIAGAAIGIIGNSAKVYYKDVLSITYTAHTGYYLTNQGDPSITVPDSDNGSGLDMSGVKATAVAKTFKLSYNYNITNAGDIETKCYENVTNYTTETQSKDVTYGSHYTLPEVNDTAYYVFVGWYLSDGKTNVPFKNGVSEKPWDYGDQTLYAHWAKKPQYAQYTYVKTVNDFTNISKNTSGKYLLIADIDFGNKSYENDHIISTFNGELHGNGKTIKNFKISLNSSSSVTDNKAVGLFGHLQSKAYVHDFCVKNSSITMDTNFDGDGWVYAGIVVGSLDCELKNVDTNGCEVSIERHKASYGGIAGYVSSIGKILNCDSNNISMYGNGDTGGIAGMMREGVIQNCTVTNSTIWHWADDWVRVKNPRASVGGICGEHNHGSIIRCTVGDTYFVLEGHMDIMTNIGMIVGVQNGGLLESNSAYNIRKEWDDSIHQGIFETEKMYYDHWFAAVNGHAGATYDGTVVIP